MVRQNFTVHVPLSSTFTRELYGIFLTLTMLDSRHFNLLISTDSLRAVECIQPHTEFKKQHEFVKLIMENFNNWRNEIYVAWTPGHVNLGSQRASRQNGKIIPNFPPPASDVKRSWCPVFKIDGSRDGSTTFQLKQTRFVFWKQFHNHR